MSELIKVESVALETAIHEARRVIGTPVEDEVLAKVRKWLLDLHVAVDIDLFMSEFLREARGAPSE